jgi:hypothetical protein
MQPSHVTRRSGLEDIAMKSHILGFALLSVGAIVATAPAQGQNGTLTRSFVSSAGSDSNPCTITQPCASFAQAYTAIGANGIIAALDPGKYGSITIISPVTVNGNGWAAISGDAQGNGITINAGSGTVILTGLEFDGASVGYNGIVDNSPGSLSVTNCTLRNFVWSGSGTITGNGILMQPAAGTLNFTITNTTASNNGSAGIVYQPPSGIAPNGYGVIDHVVTNANLNGISINTTNASGGTTIITVSNSIASENIHSGWDTELLSKASRRRR